MKPSQLEDHVTFPIVCKGKFFGQKTWDKLWCYWEHIGNLARTNWNMVGTKKSIKISNPTCYPPPLTQKERKKKKTLMNACEVSLAA
jgi:hypothetical protein